MAGRTIGENVRAIRQRRGLTQQALADRLGMRQPQLNGIEHGRYGLVQTATLLRLATALACSVDDLLAGVNAAYDEARPRPAPDRRPRARRR